MAGLQYISIVIEALIAIMGVMIAVQKKRRTYGWGISLTFGIYVLYDFAKLMKLNIAEGILSGLFFIATASALWVVFSIYRERRKR
jgi:hypothetical protein